MFWILIPFWPTQEPTGSIFSFGEYTAILLPGSLDTLFISITPSYISGISNSNNFLTNSGDVLETITCGAPFIPLSTSNIYALILSLTLYFSVGTCSFTVIIPSNFPKSNTTTPPSAFCTIPETISPFLSLNSLNKTFLETSLIFCTITCFAVCAAILPKFLGIISTSALSPISKFLFMFLASCKFICNCGSSTISTTSFSAYTWISPVSLSIVTLTFSAESKFLLYAVTNAVSIDSSK